MAGDVSSAPRRKIGCFGWLLIMAAAIALLLWSAWPSDKDMRRDRDAKLNGSAQEQVTADEFRAAWQANEVGAKERFSKSAITLTGRVRQVRESNGDSMVVSFDTKDGVGVETSVDVEDRAAVALINPGMQATVHCSGVIDVLGARVLHGCRLKKAGK